MARVACFASSVDRACSRLRAATSHATVQITASSANRDPSDQPSQGRGPYEPIVASSVAIAATARGALGHVGRVEGSISKVY